MCDIESGLASVSRPRRLRSFLKLPILEGDKGWRLEVVRVRLMGWREIFAPLKMIAGGCDWKFKISHDLGFRYRSTFDSRSVVSD